MVKLWDICIDKRIPDRSRKIYQVAWRFHQAGFQHNDIRPRNVTIRGDRVFLIDTKSAEEPECEGQRCEELVNLEKDLGFGSQGKSGRAPST